MLRHTTGSEPEGAAQALTARTIVVVPCFNEESRLPIRKFLDFVAAYPDIAFLFVDDGSRDGTLTLLESLRLAAPTSIATLPLPQNGGKGEAVRRGLLDAMTSNAELIGFWDADLATPLDEIREFISIASRQPEVFLVMGSRVRRLGSQIDRSVGRHIVGRVFATVASLVLGLPVYDTQCGAKLMRVQPALRAALMVPFHGRWTFDVELIQRLVREYRRTTGITVSSIAHDGIVEVPLTRWFDVSGSKVRIIDGLTAFSQLLMLWIFQRVERD